MGGFWCLVRSVASSGRLPDGVDEVDESAEIRDWGERETYEQFFDQIQSYGIEALREGVFPF